MRGIGGGGSATSLDYARDKRKRSAKPKIFSNLPEFPSEVEGRMLGRSRYPLPPTRYSPRPCAFSQWSALLRSPSNSASSQA
jgi:hypothetical protein